MGNSSVFLKSRKKSIAAVAVVFSVLLLDQLSKIWIKTHMELYEMYDITDWFKIYFVENNGMAFGIEAGGKLFLSIFRIIAVTFIILYIRKLVKLRFKTSFISCVALILAGAAGNIIDSIFYGVIFEASYPGHIASFVPWGQGYSTLLHGKVVDMLYFPLFSGTFPDWVPLWEGMIFFSFALFLILPILLLQLGLSYFYSSSVKHYHTLFYQSRSVRNTT